MNLAFYMRMYKKLKDGDIDDQDCKDIFQDEYIKFQIFCKREKEFENSLYVLEKKNVEISGSVYYVAYKRLLKLQAKQSLNNMIQIGRKLGIDFTLSEEEMERLFTEGPKTLHDSNRMSVILAAYADDYGQDELYRKLLAVQESARDIVWKNTIRELEEKYGPLQIDPDDPYGASLLRGE